MRTKYCGEIRLLDIDKKVTLCGWVDRIRKFKKFIFLDLRDREGIIQIFFHPINYESFQIALKLKNEFCIQIIGKVQARSLKNRNKNLVTGDIEIIAFKVKILNTSEVLPIDINQVNHEKMRFTYRYLDLRHPNMIRNLTIRNNITNIIQSIMQKKKFLNIETPLLTKSTPEGARDYLVPSRLYRNKYYALPQSPQLFKQLLMISGIDKYYQIVKCFRDEDLRSDRQPEFTQIDIEISFVNSKQIRHLSEYIIKILWKKIINFKLSDFPIISFNEAMKKYGSDKPDLRNPLKLIDVEHIFENNPYKNKKINMISRSAALLIPKGLFLNSNQIHIYNTIIKKNKNINFFYIKIFSIQSGKKGIFSATKKTLNIQNIFKIIKNIKANNGDMILILSGKNNLVNKILGNLRIKIGNELNLTIKNSWKPVWIIDFPMFMKDDKNHLSSIHHPFTAPKNSTIQELKNKPELIIADSYDLVINGYEIGGGSVRIHDFHMQKTVLKILNIKNSYHNEKEFDFFINALKYGTPPHAGIALGLDRITMLLTNSNSIKDVIAFPKTNSATCLMTGAPSKLTY
ncbi:aspartate--tRNA ligase [Buchnera aphidicola]|uniref:aspartate--tRNA ligase n=1 Tax=Buchnera aphidicola TaxID=9 RepID=UPI003463984F